MLIIVTIYEEIYVSVLMNICIKSFDTNINLHYIKINFVPHSEHNTSPNADTRQYICSPGKRTVYTTAIRRGKILYLSSIERYYD
jgi:hypothetical protein